MAVHDGSWKPNTTTDEAGAAEISRTEEMHSKAEGFWPLSALLPLPLISVSDFLIDW